MKSQSANHSLKLSPIMVSEKPSADQKEATFESSNNHAPTTT